MCRAFEISAVHTQTCYDLSLHAAYMCVVPHDFKIIYDFLNLVVCLSPALGSSLISKKYRDAWNVLLDNMTSIHTSIHIIVYNNIALLPTVLPAGYLITAVIW